MSWEHRYRRQAERFDRWWDEAFGRHIVGIEKTEGNTGFPYRILFDSPEAEARYLESFKTFTRRPRYRLRGLKQRRHRRR